jgi:hypothetical protein
VQLDARAKFEISQYVFVITQKGMVICKQVKVIKYKERNITEFYLIDASIMIFRENFQLKPLFA